MIKLNLRENLSQVCKQRASDQMDLISRITLFVICDLLTGTSSTNNNKFRIIHSSKLFLDNKNWDFEALDILNCVLYCFSTNNHVLACNYNVKTMSCYCISSISAIIQQEDDKFISATKVM